MKNTIIPACLLMLFSSCDPGSNYERVIQNNTDKDIKIWFFHQGVYDYPTDTITVKAHSKTQLFIEKVIGNDPAPIHPMRRIDSVLTIIDGYSLTRSMTDSNNWDYVIRQRGSSSRSGYLHIYTFTVDSTDIQ